MSIARILNNRKTVLCAAVALCLLAVSCGSKGGGAGLPGDDDGPGESAPVVDRFFWGRWVTARGGTSASLYSFSIDDDAVRVRERVWSGGAWVEREKAILRIDSATSDGLRAVKDGYVEALTLARVGASDGSLALLSDPWGIGATYLGRDGGYGAGSSFSFSLLANGTAAGRVLLPAASISLTIRNVVNAQAEIAASAGTGATFEAGPFVPGDEYEVSAAGQSFRIVPEKEGADVGDLVLTSHPYTFKIVPTFVDISDPPQKGVAPRLEDAILAGNTEDFLYPDTDYAVRFELRNEGAGASPTATVDLVAPAGLSIAPSAAISLPAIPSGSGATFDAVCRASGLSFGSADYVDLELGFSIRTADDEWSDSTTLRVYKERLYLVARAPAGAFISPERRSLAFEGFFDGYLPRRSAGYLVALFPDPAGTVGSGYAVAAVVDESFDAPGGQAAADGNDTEATASALREAEVAIGTTIASASNPDPVDFLRILPPAEGGPAFALPTTVASGLPADAEPRILTVRGGTLILSYLDGSVRRARAYTEAGGSWTATAEPSAVAGATGATALAAAVRADGSFAVLYLDAGVLKVWLSGSATFGTVPGSSGAVGGIVAAGTSSFVYVWETRDGSSRPSLWCDGSLVQAYSAYNLRLVSYAAEIDSDGTVWIAAAEGTAGTYGQTAVFWRASGSSTWTKEDRSGGFVNTTTTYDDLASASGAVSRIDLAIGSDGIPRLLAFQKPVGGYAFSPSLAARSATGSAPWRFDTSLSYAATAPRFLVGKDPSLALDSAGTVHAAYREGSRPVYLTKSGSAWVTRHLAERGRAAGPVLVDLDAAGAPVLYWYDPLVGSVARAARGP